MDTSNPTYIDRGLLHSARHWLRTNRATLACLLIACVHAVLGVAFSLNTPLWESYDETGHYSYARFIALNNRLPTLGEKLSDWDESHQPPLYYWLASLPIRLVDVSDDAKPRITVNRPVLVAPDPQLDAFPYRGTALGIRSARMVSVLLGTLAVVMTYAGGKTLFPRQPGIALFATAVYAMWPLLLFMGGVISNDVAVALCGSFVLWQAARVYRRSPVQPVLGTYFALAVGAVGAVSSKDNGITLVAFAALVVAADTIRRIRARGWQSALGTFLSFVVPFLALLVLSVVVSDGRTLRQFASASDLAGGLLGSGSVASSQDSVTGLQRVSAFVGGWLDTEWRTTFRSWFGAFGWGSVVMPETWYDIALMASAVCGVSVLYAFYASKKRLDFGFLALMALCVVSAPVVRTMVSGNPHALAARFFLPMLGAVCIMLAISLNALPRRIGRTIGLFVLSGLSLVSIMIPALVLQPTYRRPELLDSNLLPKGMDHSVDIRFGNDVVLLGYSAPSKTWPGQDIELTLFWRVLRDIQQDSAVWVDMFAIDGTSFVNGIHVTPGRGVFPTGFWKKGDTFADPYRLSIPRSGLAPTLAYFKVRWDFMTDGRADQNVVCDSSRVCDGVFGGIAVGASGGDSPALRSMKPVFKVSAQSGSFDALVFTAPTEIRAGEPITVSVQWRVTRGGLPDLISFVHVIDERGQLVAQKDGPPRNGGYPTHVWTENDFVPDTYRVSASNLNSGTYNLRFGFYDSVTKERARLTDAGGNAVTDNMINVGVVTVR